jgi:hypothetical protein
MIDEFKHRRFMDVLAIFGWSVLLGVTAWGVWKIGKALKRLV